MQYDIAEFLESGPKRRMVQAFRGVGKSWLTAAYVLWRLYWDPNERILVVSASKVRADAFTTFAMRLIKEIEWLQWLAPGKDQRESVVAFDVGPSDPHQAPSVRSTGITGQMTGGRATIIVADDIETPANSMTLLMRERLAEQVKEFDAILVPEEDDPDAEIIYLGTPQQEESVYMELPERGYTVRTWPACKPSPEWMTYYEHNLTPYMKGRCDELESLSDSTDPIRFSNEDLGTRRLSYGAAGFALQFMLDTRLSDADKYPLRINDLMVMGVGDMAPLKVVWSGASETLAGQYPSVGLKGDRWRTPVFTHRDYGDFTGSMMFIDPSGRGVDETSYAIVKMSNSMLYLVASGGYREGYSDEVMTELAKVAAKHQVNIVEVEPNFGDGMFTELFRPHLKKHHKCSLDEGPRASIQKEKRIIDALEPVMNQHRLVVCESVVKRDVAEKEPHRQLFYQLTRITKERGALKNDDRLDALAGAVRHWTDRLSLDTDEAVRLHTDKAMDDEIADFLRNALGAGSVQSNNRVVSSFMV